MLPKKRRVTTREINRLLGHSSVKKIPAYPFVFFVWAQHPKRLLEDGENKRAIQLPNKILKKAVDRHLFKRLFYIHVGESDCPKVNKNILAVPQKKRWEELTQLLATEPKTDIMRSQAKKIAKSLSILSKELWALEKNDFSAK